MTKSLQQIKELAQKADYTQVANIVGKGKDLVRKVINSQRADHHNIQKTFSDLLELRERLAKREANRRARQKKKA